MAARSTKKTKKPSNSKSKVNRDTFTVPQTSLDIQAVLPKTENQKRAFDHYKAGKNIVLHGVPGTGKSFIGMYLALNEIMNGIGKYKKLVIIRSSQPSKNMGFLPGTAKQKMEVYEAPYVGICAKLFGRSDAYDILKQRGLVEFESTSFLRGMTIDDSIVMLEEAQNLSWNEEKTVLSRLGDNTRVIINGDVNQDDLTSERFSEQSGLPKALKILGSMSSVRIVDFGVEDIVRSGFVKELIIAELELSDSYNHETQKRVHPSARIYSLAAAD